VTNWRTLIIRAVLGAVFGVVLSRFFFPNAPVHLVVMLCLILFGLAYLTEYLRQRKKKVH
jgi:uncharacterized membrane protein YoaK (UPF0700 family)